MTESLTLRGNLRFRLEFYYCNTEYMCAMLPHFIHCGPVKVVSRPLHSRGAPPPPWTALQQAEDFLGWDIPSTIALTAFQKLAALF